MRLFLLVKNTLDAISFLSRYHPFPRASASRRAACDITKSEGSLLPEIEKHVAWHQTIIGNGFQCLKSRQYRVKIGLELWTKSPPKVHRGLHTFIPFPAEGIGIL